MLTQVHFLLTYACNYECDHCFLYCSPNTGGTFTISQVKHALDEARKLDTVEWVYFEGGEPFLYYPVMLEGLRQAGQMGFKTGVVTNSYWATSREDAVLWLRPILESGIRDLKVSDDAFHHDENEESPARIAFQAAASLGFSAGSICIERPAVRPPADVKGEPVVEGGALFKGRAVEKLADGLPTKPLEDFIACNHEELVKPKRVHVDSFGNVQVCQGLSIGNMWQEPFSKIIRGYRAETHPVCGPLARGGPVELARENNMELKGEFVDECHYCYLVRRGLLDKFPKYLSPRQVYGISEDRSGNRGHTSNHKGG